MPIPLSPPPLGDYGALTCPRMLQRWLDDNPITKLTRVGSTIALPAFIESSNVWNGYSDIVAAFNFEAPNNFSLEGFVGNPLIQQLHQTPKNLVTDVEGNFIPGV